MNPILRDEEIVNIVRAFVEYDGTPEAYTRMRKAHGRYRSPGAAKA